MRAPAAFAALLLLGACGGGGQPANMENGATLPPRAPDPPEAPAPPRTLAPPRMGPAGNVSAPADPGLANMSPSRRRAYDRGFSDCSAGRYDPDHYPEAYRIGCAAAHDR